MKTIKHLAVTATLATAALALTGCAGMSQQDKNTAIGAGAPPPRPGAHTTPPWGGGAGAVIGGALTGGSAVGTVGGAAVGGVVGNQVGKTN